MACETIRVNRGSLNLMRRWPLVVLFLLAACSKGDDWAPSDSARKSDAAVPGPPNWARPLLQQNTRTGFEMSKDCTGSFDAIKVRYSGSPSGVEGEGWGWLYKASAAPTRIIIVDAEGKIIGAGETIIDRPDVKRALKVVTTPRVGWRAEIYDNTGNATAMALLDDRTLCSLGGHALQPL